MTRDEVLAMKPGRELDALVIRHILNIPIVKSVDLFSQEPFPAAWWVEDEGWYVAYERDEDGLIYMPFNPSEDIAAAWEVEEEINKRNLRVVYCQALKTVMHSKDEYVGMFDFVHASPADRCKAALLAVMDGEDEASEL